MFQLLDAFVAAGFKRLDTADVYSNGCREIEAGIRDDHRQLAEAQREAAASDHRTKAGSEMGPGKKDFPKLTFYAAVEDSLQRLQTDYIDLYQSHMMTPITPLEETLKRTRS